MMAVFRIIGIIVGGAMLIAASQMVVAWMKLNNINDMIRNNREAGVNPLTGIERFK